MVDLLRVEPYADPNGEPNPKLVEPTVPEVLVWLRQRIAVEELELVDDGLGVVATTPVVTTAYDDGPYWNLEPGRYLLAALDSDVIVTMSSTVEEPDE